MPRGVPKNKKSKADLKAVDLQVPEKAAEAKVEVAQAPAPAPAPPVVEAPKPVVVAAPPPPPKPKGLNGYQIEHTLRLAQEITAADKDLQLYDEKSKCLTYEERLLLKDKELNEKDVKILGYEKALIEKKIEAIALKKQLDQAQRRDFVNRKDNKQKDYRDFSAQLSKELGVDFSKCAFDPITGQIESV